MPPGAYFYFTFLKTNLASSFGGSKKTRHSERSEESHRVSEQTIHRTLFRWDISLALNMTYLVLGDCYANVCKKTLELTLKYAPGRQCRPAHILSINIPLFLYFSSAAAYPLQRYPKRRDYAAVGCQTGAFYGALLMSVQNEVGVPVVAT